MTMSPSRALISARAIGVIRIAPRQRVDHFRTVEPPHEKTNAAIDLAQALLAVDVVAVFGAVTVARGPCDGRNDFRTFLVDELAQLRLQAREAARRHVV